MRPSFRNFVQDAFLPNDRYDWFPMNNRSQRRCFVLVSSSPRLVAHVSRIGSPMSAQRKKFLHLLLSLATVSGGGCAATHSVSSLVATKPAAAGDSSDAFLEASEVDPAVHHKDVSDLVEGDVDLVNAELDDVDETSPIPVTVADVVTQDGGATVLSSSEKAMSLADFEALALTNNPTIQELVATTQKAAGYKLQVGLQANPTLGYQGTQIADAGTDQHTVYISQTFITADKLQLNRRVLNEALRHQLLQLEAQKYRVATDVRIKFYQALAAQQRVQLVRDFQSVADKGLELAELRKKALEGSQLDVVQAKVLKNEIDLAVQQAEVNLSATWRELAAIAGSTQMMPTLLEGTLPSSEQTQDWSTLAATLVVSSPEYQAAQARVCQARANLERQCVQPIPNVDFQFAAGTDNGTNSGLINLQVGAPIPVFNKNQGNISAARAELARASREVERIENSIKSRIGEVSRDYDSSMVAVEKYAKDILPNATEGMRLADLAYKAGETSFVQVLVARQSYFDTNLQYIAAQAQLAGARARVDGFVLSGALDAVIDESGDDSLRGLTLSQQ